MTLAIYMSLIIATFWFWSYQSARVNRMLLSHDPEALLFLPMWVMKGQGQMVLAVVNILLLIPYLGLPIACLFLFPFGKAIIVIGGGFVGTAILGALATILLQSLMIRYFAAAAASLIVAISIAFVEVT